MERSTQLIDDNFDIREFDKDTIHKIIRSSAQEQGINDFVKQINICQRGKRDEGYYYPYDRLLVINLNVIEKAYQRFLRTNRFELSNFDFISNYNLFVLNAIYHELTHADQYRESLSGETDSLHRVIKDNFALDTNPGSILYNMFNKKILLERNADFNAVYSILERDKKAKFLSKEDYIGLKKQLLFISLYGYSSKKTPVSRYYALKRQKSRLSDIPFTEDYSLKEALSWGLPVSLDTLDKLDAEARKVDPDVSLILR